MDNEDDIYGEDIYGAAAFDGAGQDVGPPSSTAQKTNQAVPGGTDVTALQSQLSEKDSVIASLEARLAAAEAAVDEWKGVFSEAGGNLDGRTYSEPAAAVAELKRLRTASEKVQPVDDHATLRQREAVLQMQLAEKNLENLELRRQAHAARQCMEPSISQLRQLLLDPAVAKEFQRLKAELEAKAKEVKGLQEELQAVQFSQESKAGRMLMAKCRALQDENEEMGKELAEGKVHALERQVALAKTYVEDMRARYLELEDHAHALDAESEDLHQQVFVLKRQLREADGRLPAGRDRERERERERSARSLPAPPKYNGQAGYGGGGDRLPGPPGHSLAHDDRKRGPPMRDDAYGGGKRMR